MARWFLIAASLVAAAPICAQTANPANEHVEKNVVYGMYSGLALLMDVYRPAKPNGIGVVYMGGTAWHAPLTYDAAPLKDRVSLRPATRPLVDAGYTVFVINYRTASRFRYPAPVEDAQRAVRYVRHHAGEFGVRPDRIGAAGHSSGATLALLLGVLDGNGNPQEPDLVERESAKVQAVVSLAAATDFVTLPVSFVQSSYLGVVLMDPKATSSPEYKIYREASAVFHATKDDPPTLLIHGDADPIVPFRNVELMNKALSDAGVTVTEIVIKGGGHFPPYPAAEPDPFRETVKWFDKYLAAPPATQ